MHTYISYLKLQELIKLTYFSSKKSIRKVEGFPTTVGSFCVVPHIAPTMHPAPELKKPKYAVFQLFDYKNNVIIQGPKVNLPGHSCRSVRFPTASRFVAINRHPGFSRIQRVPYLADNMINAHRC